MAVVLRAPRHRRLPLAISLSAAVHLVLLAAFILGLRAATAPTPSPPVDLELVAPARRQQPAPAPTAAAPVAPAAPRSAATPEPPTQSAFPALPTQPATPQGPSLAAALRGRLGCDHAALLQLTAAEQRACQGRLAGAAGEGRLVFTTDAATVAAFEAARGPLRDDFLLSMPKTGCKPRVVSEQITSAAGAAGRQDIHAGVTCVIRF